MPDVVKSMAWGADSLIVGLTQGKEYWLADTASGLRRELLSSGRTVPPIAVALPDGELLLGKVSFLRAGPRAVTVRLELEIQHVCVTVFIHIGFDTCTTA